jgi:hypothetical protein
VIAANLNVKPAQVTLRCYCGTTVRHDAVPPPPVEERPRLAG